LTYNVSGLVGSDTLKTAPTLSTTATAGSPLGSYTITVAGASASSDYEIHYKTGTLTVTPVPVITSTSPSLTDGTLAANQTTLAIQYNVAVVGAGTAANYELRSVGADGLLGTTDDTIVPVSATYNGTTATLTFAAIAEGVYRLTVHDAITDAYGNAIDGNSDGVCGGDWVADFVVVADRGSLSFNASTYTSGDLAPSSIATGDFNSDGIVDLAVTHNRSIGTIGILLGKGDGTFSTATTFSSGGAQPNCAATGDFNGDGKLDVVIGCYGNTVAVLLGDGTGGCSLSHTYSSGGGNPRDIVAHDFNHDGKLDIAVLNGTGTANVFLGDGGGSFTTIGGFSTGAFDATRMAVGDFNHDGNFDLAVTDSSSGTVGILLGASNGSFSLVRRFSSGGSYPQGVAVGDFNHDGNADLAVTNTMGNNVAVFLCDATGSFAEATTYSTGGSNPISLAIGDFDYDGMVDLAVVNSSSIRILRGTVSGSFLLSSTVLADGRRASDIAVADFNGDGKIDIALACELNYNLLVLTNIPSPLSVTVTSGNGVAFDVGVGANGTGELIQGTNNAFDGDGRLIVGDTAFQADSSYSLDDGGCTIVTASGTAAGLTVHREITVPNTGNADFARTLDTFTNSTGSTITTTVKIVGNLGSDAKTAVFMTSDGDNVVEATDAWFATDDANGTGSPAVVHYIHGPAGLQPVSARVVGDNVEWTYEITVAAGKTVRLGYLTIVAETQDAAVAAANDLVTHTGFGGQAGAFLTSTELASLGNFQFYPIATTTTVAASQNLSNYGESVTFTATVGANIPCEATLAGEVTFWDGTKELGTTTLVDGSASLATSSLLAGTHSIKAVYQGNADFLTSTSKSARQDVKRAITTTTVVAAANPSAYGENLTFAVTVDAADPSLATPTGTVVMWDGGKSVGTATLDADGKATFSISTLTPRTHTLLFSYAGTSDFTNSKSRVRQTVGKAVTDCSIVASSDSSVYGEQVTYTITVASALSNAGTPVGYVTFTDNGAKLCNIRLNAEGQASLTTALRGNAGSHTIAAVYRGSSWYASSTAIMERVVAKAATITTVTASNATPLLGKAVTLTANVGVVTPGVGQLSGTMTFFDGSTVLGTVNVNSLGKAILRTNALAAGEHAITASYAGSTNFAGSSAQVVLTVALPLMADTTTELTAPAQSLTAEQLTPIVTEAMQRLSMSDRTAILAALGGVNVQVADLPSGLLAEAVGKTIVVDRDAAGYGWFIDPTPASDEEFVATATRDGQLLAVDPKALNQIDLLTVVEHELGHVLGLKDLDALADDVMSGVLGVGVRRNVAQNAVEEILTSS
jgi:hypothetical protein